jgi:predicted PurR-regulated permease PerM
LEGQILVPKIMGKSVGAHPLWVTFAVLSGTALGGIVFGLMAVPTLAVIIAAIRFFQEEVELEKWQRPLLEKTPVEEGESA